RATFGNKDLVPCLDTQLVKRCTTRYLGAQFVRLDDLAATPANGDLVHIRIAGRANLLDDVCNPRARRELVKALRAYLSRDRYRNRYPRNDTRRRDEDAREGSGHHRVQLRTEHAVQRHDT